jgi:glutaredoxin-related protein
MKKIFFILLCWNHHPQRFDLALRRRHHSPRSDCELFEVHLVQLPTTPWLFVSETRSRLLLEQAHSEHSKEANCARTTPRHCLWELCEDFQFALPNLASVRHFLKAKQVKNQAAEKGFRLTHQSCHGHFIVGRRTVQSSISQIQSFLQQRSRNLASCFELFFRQHHVLDKCGKLESRVALINLHNKLASLGIAETKSRSDRIHQILNSPTSPQIFCSSAIQGNCALQVSGRRRVPKLRKPRRATPITSESLGKQRNQFSKLYTPSFFLTNAV